MSRLWHHRMEHQIAAGIRKVAVLSSFLSSFRLILIASLLIPATAVQGTEPSSQRVGFVAGPTYGVGLSYSRQNNLTGMAWQVSGFPIWLEEDRLLYGGFTLFKTLHQGRGEGLLRLFASGGFAAYYSWHEDYPENDESLSLVFGPGVGLELRVGPFDVSADLPIAMFYTDDKSKGETRVEIIPYIPNLACFYRW